MNILNLQEKINSCKEDEWVHPANIEGFNAEQELKNRKNTWSKTSTAEDVDDSPTSIVESYLNAYIHFCLLENKQPAPPMEILDAAFYLIEKAGSTEVAFTWPVFRNLFGEDQALDVMHYMQSSFSMQSDPFVKYLLSAFILDFYKYGAMWVGFDEKKDALMLSEISNAISEQEAFEIFLKFAGENRNAGVLFHQEKMTPQFLSFLEEIYMNRSSLQERLEK